MQSNSIHVRLFVCAVFAATCCTTSVLGQTKKSTLAISSVKASPSLVQSVQKSGKSIAMGRMLEAFDGQLIDRINATRKFAIVGRSDLVEALKEQELAESGNVDLNDKNAARAGKMAGAKYFLTTTVDDWEDSTERMEFPTQQKVGLKRKVRISVVAKIYDSSTVKLLESASIQLTNMDTRTDSFGLEKNAELTDELLLLTVKDVAGKVANRVADVIYPIKVLVKRGQNIIINRGDGGSVATGQLWNVYAVGEALIDPDTGENLGAEELLVGKARIISVAPKTSTAEILEDNGINRGAVLRLPAP
ncbi:MAG: curli biogenesis system outer membrane secretion channel CsgG [Candidatus Binatia bacterium]|jgi:curli biogenesis system outer membrane secretion channel CsgG